MPAYSPGTSHPWSYTGVLISP